MTWRKGRGRRKCRGGIAEREKERDRRCEGGRENVKEGRGREEDVEERRKSVGRK